MYGAILGGIMVAWLPERFRNFTDKRVLVFGIALVLVMVFRPEGLLPRRVRTKTPMRSSSAGKEVTK
jgi:branched-chain amino acid transport system permease protein